MQFKINKNYLVNGLQHASRAVSAKTTIPILTGIKFEVDDNGLTITSSDSDITIQMTIPPNKNDQEILTVVKEGKIVLPKYIVDIVKKLPSDEIEFNMVDNLTVLVKSGKSEFRLNGYDAEEFPDLPSFNEEYQFNIKSDLFKTMIRQTIFAVSSLESRPILTGVLWQLEDSILRFIATDSHRLAMRESIVESPDNLKFSNIVVPGKSLNELSKILSDDQKEVNIIVNENQMIVKIGSLIFISRLLDGTYPDISRIIPNQGKSSIVLKTKDLLDAIERASLIVKDSKNSLVKLTTFEDLTMEITSNLPEIGKVTENLTLKEYSGDSLKISFNAKYAIEALKAIDSQDILIDFTGALSPFLIKPMDSVKMLYLILPVRTN